VFCILRVASDQSSGYVIAIAARFEIDFCTPEEPHEKGGIEGEAGFRRNHWVPLPQVRDLDDLNAQLFESGTRRKRG
jgi:hypothetical protein